jgi:hypothetical protein
MELTGAGYGAVGVLGADGHLMSFVDTGIDEATVARWGKIPSARGCRAFCSTNPNKRWPGIAETRIRLYCKISRE